MTLAIRHDDALRPYVPDLLSSWRPTHGDPRHMQVPGTLAFVDISGFTALTERLARRGKVGAEEMSDLLNATFAALLSVAREQGADLVKWGGDAVLLLFRGTDHPARACRAAHDMRATLRSAGRLHTEAGNVTLRMSVGVHSGRFDFYLVGDPSQHEELLVVGPEASRTAEMEQLAVAGQVVVSEETAALLPAAHAPGPAAGARLLRSRPAASIPQLPLPRDARADLDLGRYLSPVVRDQVLADPGDAEHRTVAVGFVQFRGTDELVRTAGAAAAAEALDACIRNVQNASAANGVTFFETDIDRDGGKVMLVAGAPRSAGRDEERMLRTARAIVERQRGPITVRVGVNRGAVFAGDFGPSFRRTYSIKGDAVNLAARVMGKAAPGEVLATRETLVRSQTRFETAPLEPFLVKGKAKPVDAARVGPVAGERHDRRPPTPFVGRGPQTAAVRAALAQARRGAGRELVVAGGAGSGKTRLIAEVLRDADVRVVRCSGSAYESATAYFPFRALLRNALGASDDAAEALVTAVATRAPHLAPWLPLLAAPLDVTLPPTPETSNLDDQFRTARLEQAVVDLLTAVLDEPTALVVDDAHHLDAASASLLHELSSAITTRPWLLVVAGREGRWPYEPPATVEQVQLGPLDPAEAAALVRALDVPVTAATRAALIERSGGNPMFLEELVRTAGRAGPAAPLPESVQELMTSQVDELPPLDRTVLRYAAVLGVVADVPLLEQLLAEQLAGERLAAHLPSLADLLDLEDAQHVRFRHALLRDVAYEGLPFRRRRALHEQVAVALERQDPDAELLSLHFFAAGRYDRAWSCSRAAGRAALAKYANADAVVLFERAVEAARRSGSVPPVDLAAVLDQLGDVRDVAGLPVAAIDAYQRARRLRGPDPVARAELLFKEARCQQRLGHVPQSLRLLTRALTSLDGCTGATAHATRSHVATRYAWGRMVQGRPREGLAWATRAAREAEDAGDPRTLAHAYNALHFAHQRAQVPEDVPYGRLALQGYAELGDLNGQGHSAGNLGVDATMAGRYDEALELFEQARALFGRAGNAAEEANATYNCGDVLLRLGRASEAHDLLVEALLTARAVADEELVALATRELGRALLDLGRVEEAERHLADAGQRLAALGIDPD